MLNEDWIIEFIIRATFSLQNRVFSYIQAEKAVQIAVPRLLSMGVKVIRPSDYYAEMAKSDGHMQKVCNASALVLFCIQLLHITVVGLPTTLPRS